MGLSQPTNLFPSSFRGEGGDVIDATVDNQFSWQLNGNSGCIAYQILVMANDAASTTVYNSTIITISTTYPRDYNNNPVRISHTVPANTFTNGFDGGYKWKVALWAAGQTITGGLDGGAANDDEPVTSAVETFFITRAAPYFTVASIGTVAQKSVTLTASYTQTNGTPLEWYRWVITDGNGNTIKDTGEIFSQNIRVDLDGLFADTTYTYTLTGQTSDGVTVPTVTGTFLVEYERVVVQSVVTTQCDPDTGAITVSAPTLTAIPGSSTSSVTYLENQPVDGATSAQSSASIVFNTVNGNRMSFPTDSVLVTSFAPVQSTGTGSNSITLANINAWNAYVISVGNGTATSNSLLIRARSQAAMNPVTVLTLPPGYAPDEIWITAIMQPHTESDGVYLRTWFAVYVKDYANAPSDELYPSNELYPSSSFKWVTAARATYDLKWTTNTFTQIYSISAQARSPIDYIWVSDTSLWTDDNGELLEDRIEQYLQPPGSDGWTPEYDSGTLLLANFNGSIEGGNYTAPSGGITGWDAYRQKVGGSALQYLGALDISGRRIVDYLVENNKEYAYYLFPTGTDTVGAPLTSETATSSIWNWVLIEAEESDAPNIYSFVNAYVFQGNIETGAISNNANENVLQNFTRYPKILKGTSNYKSGQLKALIGKVDYTSNKFTQADGLMDELMELSTSENHFFLKNRAGDIWEVSVAAEMQMIVDDKSPYQPYTMTLNWREIGSADGISVIGAEAIE